MDSPKTSLLDMGMALRRFGLIDYIVFAFMLLICVVIGIYYGFCAGKTSEAEYLMGGRKMKTFPVAMSLIASFISGITLLGTPTEVYLYGVQYCYISISVIAMAVVVAIAYLPVFHDLKLTSTYEYLELRFNKKVRLFGSFLFFIGVMIWLPIVIYVPALAFNQVTGVNIHIITPAVCIVCIFYTSMGGLKAVVWTDVIQTLIMLAAMLLIIIKGTMNVGGLSVVWSRSYETGRIEAPDFSSDPTMRHTALTLWVGGFFWWLQVNAVNQNMIQRYLTLPNMRAARFALCIFVIGAMSFLFLCSYCGLLIFATYHDCDPLTTKLAVAKDQLLPLLVMDTLKGLPGLPGVFVAGVFSAALSSLSTGLNSMAAVILEDFYKRCCKHKMSPQQTNIFLKIVVIVLGTIAVILVFVVEKLGSVLQLSMSLSGMSSGPSLGIFSMGLFFPWINSKGALVGGLAGMGFMGWIIGGTQEAIASGNMRFETKPLTVEGCSYEFVTPTSVYEVVNSTLHTQKNDVFILYQMSYLWYTLIGALVSIFVGLVVSFVTTPLDPASVDSTLLSPIIRPYMPKKKDKQDVNMELLHKYNIRNPHIENETT
ncbi:Sodium-coupled monocarboxylate transporter 1 [Blattella germanica]|nr:Sodium-coupled monocarboxylate transporter 1 [Blattella germanica]